MHRVDMEQGSTSKTMSDMFNCMNMKSNSYIHGTSQSPDPSYSFTIHFDTRMVWPRFDPPCFNIVLSSQSQRLYNIAGWNLFITADHYSPWSTEHSVTDLYMTGNIDVHSTMSTFIPFGRSRQIFYQHRTGWISAGFMPTNSPKSHKIHLTVLLEFER